jgi:hypothetical protein
MTTSSLHIVFGDTAARVLKGALEQAGRKDRVAWFPDDLGVGPIASSDPLIREAWVRREFGIACNKWDWPIHAAERFWKSALSTRRRRVVWFSRRVVGEFCGFLEFVRRAADGPYDVADLTELNIGAGDCRLLRRVCLADLYDRPTVIMDYLANARPLAPAERDAYGALWARLRGEDALLRVLDETRLISAPLSHFDELLLSCTVEHWRKVARVLGETLVEIWETGFHQVSDIVLAARVRALVAEGRLESRGDVMRIRHSEIRLPQRNEVVDASGTPTVPYDASSSVSQ